MHVPDLRLDWLRQLALFHVERKTDSAAEAAQCHLAAACLITEYLLGLGQPGSTSDDDLAVLKQICPDAPPVPDGLFQAALRQTVGGEGPLGRVVGYRHIREEAAEVHLRRAAELFSVAGLFTYASEVLGAD